jgi:prepilin-type N-terminal cleavage/methylation domain-containing protein
VRSLQSRGHGKPGGTRRAAFTLPELVCVLVILSAVAGIAVPAFFTRPTVTLDNACQLLAKDIRIAQNWAAFQHIPIRVEFREDGDGYHVVDATGTPLPNPYEDGTFGRRFSSDGVFEGVSVTRFVSGEAGALVFNALGMVEEGGHVVLSFRGDARILTFESGVGNLRVLGGREPWSDRAREGQVPKPDPDAREQ